MVFLKAGSAVFLAFTLICGGVFGDGFAKNTYRHAELIEDHYETSTEITGLHEPQVLGRWTFEVTDYYVLSADDPMFSRSIQRQVETKEVAVIVFRFKQSSKLDAMLDKGSWYRDGNFTKARGDTIAADNFFRAKKGMIENPWYLPYAEYNEWVTTAGVYLIPKGSGDYASFGLSSEVSYTQDLFFWSRDKTDLHIAMFDLGLPRPLAPKQTAAR
jgi:hypothetical protein